MRRITNIFLFFGILYNLIKSARNEQNTSAILNISKLLYAMGLLQSELEKIKDDPEISDFIKRRYQMNQHQYITELEKSPQGTLGHEYAKYMITNKLSPNFYEPVKVVNDTTYIMLRMRQTHDFWHVITGFDTDVAGELGLLSFMFAQVRTPLAPLIICARCFISTFTQPEDVRRFFDHVARGWVMGRQAKPIFAVDWEAHFATPVFELRRSYDITVNQ